MLLSGGEDDAILITHELRRGDLSTAAALVRHPDLHPALSRRAGDPAAALDSFARAHVPRGRHLARTLGGARDGERVRRGDLDQRVVDEMRAVSLFLFIQ